jgi:hypothetical protein
MVSAMAGTSWVVSLLSRQLRACEHRQPSAKRMIAFSIARAKRILLISFPLPVTRETLRRLDAERAAVTLREGAMDMILDFTESPPVAIPSTLTHERVGLPSPVPGFRRLYVAPRDDLYGSLRMYAIPHDDPRVEVVRSLNMAFAELDVAPSAFEPLRA